jgi:hypothetical protein
MYRHTQIGWLIWALCVPLLLFSGVIALLAWRDGESIYGFAALAVPVAVLLLFPSLTVTVDDGAVEIQYGTGLIRKRFPLAEVDTAEPVRNPWIAGWGIRLLWLGGGKMGWLFNISGLEAVELRMKDGRVYRIGTDEPQALHAAIQERLGERSLARVELEV